MSKHTKVDAARLINVSRATLYNYIKQGRISTDPDGKIDTAELLRAGFDLHPLKQSDDDTNRQGLTVDNVLNQNPQVMSKRVQFLEDELSTLRQQLADAQFENQKLTEDTATERTRLLDMLEREQKNQQLLLEAGKRSPWWRVWRKG